MPTVSIGMILLGKCVAASLPVAAGAVLIEQLVPLVDQGGIDQRDISAA